MSYPIFYDWVRGEVTFAFSFMEKMKDSRRFAEANRVWREMMEAEFSEPAEPFNYNDVYTKKPKKEGDVGFDHPDFFWEPDSSQWFVEAWSQNEFKKRRDAFAKQVEAVNEIQEKEQAARNRGSEWCQ